MLDQKTKKFVLWGAVILIVLVAGYFLIQKFGIGGKTFFTQKESDSALAPIQTVSLQNYIDKDTDGDGLKDWEEGLWGTDPTKKDTDGDGTPDNVLVENKKAALAAENPQINQSSDTTPGESGNETDVLSQQIWSMISAMNESGSLTTENKQRLGGAVAEYLGTGIKDDQYSLSNLKITTNINSQTVLKYIVDIGDVIKKNPLSTTGPFEAFQAYAETGNQYYYNQLDTMSAAYKKMMLQLLEIAVPPNAAQIDLAIINALAGLSRDISAMQYVDENPAPALSAVSQYGIHNDELGAGLSALENYVSNAALTF